MCLKLFIDNNFHLLIEINQMFNQNILLNFAK